MTYEEEHAWDDLIPFQDELKRLMAIDEPTDKEREAIVELNEELRKRMGIYS